MNEEEKHILQRWFSIGDLISLIAMLLALAYTYGSLSRDVESVKTDISQLKSQRITPGAESALASIVAKDAAQDDAIRALREELRYQRNEILDAITKLDARLEQHSDNDR
jgi:hypothetical protein